MLVVERFQVAYAAGALGLGVDRIVVDHHRRGAAGAYHARDLVDRSGHRSDARHAAVYVVAKQIARDFADVHGGQRAVGHVGASGHAVGFHRNFSHNCSWI